MVILGLSFTEMCSSTEQTRSRVVLIILHFGEKWPLLYPPFLVGAAANSELDFVIVSNLDTLPMLGSFNPPNIRLHQLSVPALNQLLQDKLQRPPEVAITLRTAYKLVDFKTMFAHLFPDIVAGYEFWGHIDADTLPSRIVSPHFLDPSMLDDYDIISGTNGMCNGPFQLYRNRHDINVLFRNSKDFRGVVDGNFSSGFTENHGEMRMPHALLIRRHVIKEKATWNHTANTYLEDRWYFRHGAARNHIWSPKWNLRLRWDDDGLFQETISHDRTSVSPTTGNAVPGFFHLISWKYLADFRLPMPDKVLANLRRTHGRLVYVSCHGFHAVDDINDAAARAAVERESLKACVFPKQEVFFRVGTMWACVGGVNGYDNMVKIFNNNKAKHAKKATRRGGM